MIRFESIHLPIHPRQADAGIRRLYPIDDASWVWHPDYRNGSDSYVKFENRFETRTKSTLICHLSADQRFELSIDGFFIGIGPDRCDVAHWSFKSYRIELEPGTHSIQVDAWWLAHPPTAQVTWKPGFIFCAEGDLGSILNTGSGSWTASDLTAAMTFVDHTYVHQAMVGKAQIIDGDKFFSSDNNPVPPRIVQPPIEDNMWAGMRNGWRMHPSNLPNQLSRILSPGTAIATIDGGLGPDDMLHDRHFSSNQTEDFTKLISGQESLVIPPNTHVSYLWDLGDYYCGYSLADVSASQGASVEMLWFEAAFRDPASRLSKWKGSRKALVGKYVRGLRDAFLCDSKSRREFKTCWFRSGNYILVTIRTHSQPLTIHSLSIRETRYPLENNALFVTDNPKPLDIIPMMVRAMQMCSHETFFDCPHYEQLMYVGDTRIIMLTSLLMSNDSRLVERGIRILEWSRHLHGLINSCYPGGGQIIPAFPIYWILMVHDYAYWRDDPSLIRDMLPTVRDTIHRLRAYQRADGLIGDLPGWNFIDTAPEWEKTIYGPSNEAGPSAIFNLLFVYVLKLAADLERFAGEPEFAKGYERIARDIGEKAIEAFWIPDIQLFADDRSHKSFSEHAQIMALLGKVLSAKDAKKCFNALVSLDDNPKINHFKPFAKAQTYWMFYLFEVYHLFGRGELLLNKLDSWQEWHSDGFHTTPEMFEPSRSDCHAWGAHPLFHYHATIAGIRPTAPGFKTVLIEPNIGSMKNVISKIPHPRGTLSFSIDINESKGAEFIIDLPPETTGVLIWKKAAYDLKPGKQIITAPLK